MFLIDHPYISDFLLETIRKNQYPLVATKAAKQLISDGALNWISEEEAIITIKANPTMPIYSNSENALSWVDQHLGDLPLAKQIKNLKDKFQFRKQIKALFPEYKYQEIALADIQDLKAEELDFPFVIKPSVGFFSIGVHIVADEEDLAKVKQELRAEKLKSIFPENVLNVSHFIIEEFIVGDEYAVDYYHDSKGEVVILNVMHHVFTDGKDTSDRVYSTSREIIEKYEKELGELLYKIGQELGLKNFPGHAEVRIDSQGKIVPIEINPLRFGGLCTTADISGVCLGLNSYECFFENKKPDWNQIFEGKEGKKYSLVGLDNNSGIEASDIASFDYKALEKDFEKPIMIRELDIQKFPLFGFIFLENHSGNEEELNYILTSDLRKYITLNQ